MNTQENKMHADNQAAIRILVCYKVVHDLDTVLEQDWKNPVDGKVDLSYTRRMLAGYDEAALEMALRLADEATKAGKNVELTALCIGDEINESICKVLYAVKFHRVVFLQTQADLRFAPRETAKKICGFIAENGNYDLIFMGQQVSVGDSGAVYWMAAQMLGLPALSNVIETELLDEGIRVVTESENCERTYLCRKGLVCAVGNATYCYLRVPTLREKMAASKKQIEYKELEPMEPPARGVTLTALERPDMSRSGQRIQGDTALEKARNLYQALKEAGCV